MPSDLRTDPDELHRMLARAGELVERYYSSIPSLPVAPIATSIELRKILHEPLPEGPSSVDKVFATVRDVVYPLSRHNGHPRFFGYVSSPGSAAALIGDLLASALNANVTAWRSAPAAAELERLVIDWLKAMIRYDSGATGLLVSGGSMANLSALAAARNWVAPEMGAGGATAVRAPLRVYASQETHLSIQKNARILGIGSENVCFVPTNDDLRINVVELQRRIDADRKLGYKPMCIVANAGTVNTGAVDCIGDLVDVAQRERIWLHVDGAYGAFAALTPSAKNLFAGIESANSVSLDPHKWLYSSIGCGCVLYRDPSTAIAAFAENAEYTRPVGLSGDEAFAFWDLGPELSRPFRALAIWLQVKLYGTRGLAAAIENNIACAQYFETLIHNAPNFEMLAPVTLSVFCFRFRPANYIGDLDGLNQQILTEVQRRGSSYLSNARVHGKFALRGCVVNYRTTIQDMDQLFRDVRDVAESLLPVTP